MFLSVSNKAYSFTELVSEIRDKTVYVRPGEGWTVNVCDNKSDFRASKQTTSSPQGLLSSVNVANVTPRSCVFLL